MFELLRKKEKCPICKMKIKEEYVEGYDKKFCSEDCKKKYGTELGKVCNTTEDKKGCCH